MLRHAFFTAAILVGTAGPALAYGDVYLGEIQAFAGTYCPKSWAPADGALLTIKDHQPLFAMIGLEYGGDGHTTFALPDLRSKAPAHLDKDDKGHRFKLLWCVKIDNGVFAPR